MARETLVDQWNEFLSVIKNRSSAAEFQNWISPIECLEVRGDALYLQVPNVFVQEYLLGNYQQELKNFFPPKKNGSLPIVFKVPEDKKKRPKKAPEIKESHDNFNLNSNYTFESFIEGPSNQFVKSAALGVATRPGKSYNPLFIHGGVGLGKTHLLHAIGHFVKAHNRKARIQCITTEAFINELVNHLKNKNLDKLKRFYRSLDVLLVDDIQFLENRMNFQEEFCNTFEALIHQKKQIVITSDKAPGALKLSERLIARMEWGLVAHLAVPDLETRVAILQHKAEQKNLRIPNNIAFFIAEHIYNNVRQLEGAINRLSAYCRLMHQDVTEDVVEKTLAEMFQYMPQKRVTVESILKSVSTMFNVRVSDLRGSSRTKEVAFPRQIAMYLAKELINDSLIKLGQNFGGKTHSTLLHAWKKIGKQMKDDEMLRRQVHLAKKDLES